MTSRFYRGVYACAFAIAMIAGQSASAAAADASIKVAFWNVMSGKGVDALAGHPQPFHNVTNCTDPTQPLNAWGVGAMQSELAKATADPTTLALGLVESWDNVCGSSEHIRQALGWKAHSSARNGIALVARYGFAGPELWQQLDTTLNTNPADTMWILRAPVCLDAACSQSIPVYVTHWYAMGAYAATSYTRQAQQTVAFLNATSNGQPHVLVGDLNAWEGSAVVCNQNPTNNALPYLRNAGYLDAWLTVQGSTTGYTGMANRAGCGYPEGNTWKRIDYAWTLPSFQPLDIQRFAVTPAGDASPSDHYGILVTLPNPAAGAPAPTPDPEPAPAPTPAPTAIWTSLVKSTANGATLQKISGCSSCFDAGAIGSQPIAANGSVSFSVAAGYRLIVGLGSDMSASTSYAIDYAFSFWPNGTWEIREKSVYKKEGPYSAADQFRIVVENTVVKYYRNGALVYTSLAPATAPLVMDTSLSTIGATVQNLTVAAPAPPPPGATGLVWSSLVKTSADGTTLQKSSGCGSCFDAGAVSQQQIGATGSVSFTVSAGHRQIVGLGRDQTASTSYAIDYAFSFWPGGTWEIRESSVYRKEGSYLPTDIFTVAVADGVATYYKNAVLVYTSKVPAAGPLVVDTSMATVGATVSNAVIK
jgi:hypothetical protein